VNGESRDLVIRGNSRAAPMKGETLNVVPRTGETHVFATSTGERLSA
jgi:multiple sugar transport system ATP-binding protein